MTRPWHRRQEIPDSQVRDTADQFESARELLWAQPPESGLLYTLMNTATVAIELYLKCLSAEKVYADAGRAKATVSARPSISSHALGKLLDNIDNGLQQELDDTFRDQLSSFACLSFRDALSRCEGAFQESHYPFEPNCDILKCPLGLLMACSHFLQQFVAKLLTKENIQC